MQNVLITGAGSGIGRAAALNFAASGDRVFATVRSDASAEALHEAAMGFGTTLTTVRLDLTDTASIEACAAEALAAGTIDVLINNAGIALPGPLEAQDAARIDLVMQTNFTGPLLLTRALLPAMRAQGRGAVLFVSSLSALVGLPGDGLYAASKAALEAAAEALRFEVERFGIRVAVIEPGLIATAMAGKIAAADAAGTDAAYAPLLGHLQAASADAVGRGDDPAVVVEALFAALDEPDPPFRIAAGEQARTVTEALRGLDDAGRAAFIRRVAGTDWWSRGADAPGPEDA